MFKKNHIKIKIPHNDEICKYVPSFPAQYAVLQNHVHSNKCM